MKKFLAMIVFGAVFVFVGAPTAHAGGGLSPYDFVVDCFREGTDLSVDVTEEEWADYDGGSVTVLVINCTYSCAYLNVDQPTNCGSAFFDNAAPHYFTVSGPAMIHGYIPGSGGLELFFGTTADELNFTADEQPGKIVFNWSEIDNAASYLVRSVQDPDVECLAIAPANSCTIRSAPLGETYSYTLSVNFDFEAKSEWQSMVATVDATRQATTTSTSDSIESPESTLAATGTQISETYLPAALLVLAAGLFIFMVIGRRVIASRQSCECFDSYSRS